MPSQAGLDAWARDHTFGLIDKFPIQADEVYLVLASALATKVSWQVPFDLTSASALGTGSPWAGRLERVLRTPARPRGHSQFIAATQQAGDVIVHIAAAAGGLEVVSVAAMPEVQPGHVLAAAYEIGSAHAAGLPIERRDLASLPLGEGPLWLVREVTATADSCSAVLPGMVGDLSPRPHRAWPRLRCSQARARPERRPLAGRSGGDGQVHPDGVRGRGRQRDCCHGRGTPARQAP